MPSLSAQGFGVLERRIRRQWRRFPFSSHSGCRQEAQLMLTNLHDAFIGQSRSPNI